MKTKPAGDNTYVGSVNGKTYTVNDSQAAYFSKVWEANDVNKVVENVLSNRELWDTDLSVLPGFKEAVINNLNKIEAQGITELTAA